MEPGRQEWDRSIEFLFALIGFSVGYGNIWRFPYTCYESGGGAFLVAYLIMWTLCGVPLLYMEIAIGQYTRQGPIGAIAKMCPLLKGAAVGTVVKNAITRTLYMVLLVWPFYFLFNSFKSEFPWSKCNHEWNTPNCVDGDTPRSNISYNTKVDNITVFMSDPESNTTSAAAEYFRNHVLQMTSGIDNLGSVRWEFALILLLAWVLIYFALFKGTKSVGKVVYLTVTFPYVVLAVLIIRGFTLPGSFEGLLFFITPKWHRLTEAQVWIHAAATNFFSLGFGVGGTITLASYNKSQGNILKHTLIIASVDLFTSIMAGVAVFTNVGYLAEHHGKEMEDVVNSGIELVFIVFPEIFTTMPLSQLFSVLFFLMIITLAIDSMLVGPEICVTALTDEFKHLPRREILYALTCILFYFLAFPTISQGGMYYFALIDYYFNFGSAVSLALFEIIAVSWFYGARRLAKDVLKMTGSAPHIFIVICWYFISPAIIIALLVFSIVRYSPFTFGSYVYPTWSVVMAWIIAGLPLICIPIGMVHTLYKTPSTSLIERLRLTVTPREIINQDQSIHMDMVKYKQQCQRHHRISFSCSLV